MKHHFTRTEKNLTSITQCGIRLGKSPSKNPLFWMRFQSFLYSFLFNTWVALKQNNKLHVGSLKTLSYASLPFTILAIPGGRGRAVGFSRLLTKAFGYILLIIETTEHFTIFMKSRQGSLKFWDRCHPVLCAIFLIQWELSSPFDFSCHNSLCIYP